MRKNCHFLPFSPRYQTTSRNALRMDVGNKLQLELLNLHKRFQDQRLLYVAVWSTQTCNFFDSTTNSLVALTQADIKKKQKIRPTYCLKCVQKCAKMLKKPVFF